MAPAESDKPKQSQREIMRPYRAALKAARVDGEAMGPGPYLPTPEAAGHTGLSETWLEQLRCKGEGPKFIRVGRAVRYPLAWLDEWMLAHAVDAAT
jgi:predicted DNA-binding transcriptional regulator AlpA